MSLILTEFFPYVGMRGGPLYIVITSRGWHDTLLNTKYKESFLKISTFSGEATFISIIPVLRHIYQLVNGSKRDL